MLASELFDGHAPDRRGGPSPPAASQRLSPKALLVVPWRNGLRCVVRFGLRRRVGLLLVISAVLINERALTIVPIQHRLSFQKLMGEMPEAGGPYRLFAAPHKGR